MKETSNGQETGKIIIAGRASNRPTAANGRRTDGGGGGGWNNILTGRNKMCSRERKRIYLISILKQLPNKHGRSLSRLVSFRFAFAAWAPAHYAPINIDSGRVRAAK